MAYPQFRSILPLLAVHYLIKVMGYSLLINIIHELTIFFFFCKKCMLDGAVLCKMDKYYNLKSSGQG